MKNKILPKIFILILIAIIFPSCISIERLIKINEDGSGKETFKVNFTKDFIDFIVGSSMAFDSTKGKSIADSIYNNNPFSEEITSSLKSVNGIKITDVKKEIASDSSLNLTINYTFDKVEKLSETLNSVESEEMPFGKTETKISFKKSGKKFKFKYYSKKSDMTDTSASLTNTLIPFFKDKKMVFKITFPYSITSSNALKTNGKTLLWEFDMAKMLSDTTALNMEAIMKVK
jgi:hypothetical protein